MTSGDRKDVLCRFQYRLDIDGRGVYKKPIPSGAVGYRAISNRWAARLFGFLCRFRDVIGENPGVRAGRPEKPADDRKVVFDQHVYVRGGLAHVIEGRFDFQDKRLEFGFALVDFRVFDIHSKKLLVDVKLECRPSKYSNSRFVCQPPYTALHNFLDFFL